MKNEKGFLNPEDNFLGREGAPKKSLQVSQDYENGLVVKKKFNLLKNIFIFNLLRLKSNIHIDCFGLLPKAQCRFIHCLVKVNVYY